jgi:transposase
MLGGDKSEHIRNAHLLGKDVHFEIIKDDFFLLYATGYGSRAIIEMLGIGHSTYITYKRRIVEEFGDAIERERAIAKKIRYYYTLGYDIPMIAKKTKQTVAFIYDWFKTNDMSPRATEKVTEPKLTTFKPRKKSEQKIADIEALEATVTDSDLIGEESLFCNTDFLEQLFGKKLSRRACK